MSKITNAAGREINFKAAANLMDAEISAVLDHGDGMTEQELFNAYCAKHLEKFGEEFELNKAKPIW